MLENVGNALQSLNNMEFSDEWTRFVEEYLDDQAITLLRKQEKSTTTISTISFLMMGIFKISTWLIKKMSHEIKYR